jgi:cbb3-type cytochrome oxidase cytochrome c subunit
MSTTPPPRRQPLKPRVPLGATSSTVEAGHLAPPVGAAAAVLHDLVTTVAVVIGVAVRGDPDVPDQERTSRRSRRSAVHAAGTAGRDIYVAEGCYNCHSQMIRPISPRPSGTASTRKPGEFVYDHPFQWGSGGSARTCTARAGRRATDWHYLHMLRIRAPVPNSIMPAYPWRRPGSRCHPRRRGRPGDARRTLPRRAAG